MNVSLEIPQETAEKIALAALRAGKDLPTYLQEFVNRSFIGELTAPRSVDEILAPFRAEIERSGLNDQQLEMLLSEARAQASATPNRSGQG